MSVPTQLQSARIPSRQDPTLTDLGYAIKRSSSLETEVSYPCTVVAFDSVAMTVDIVDDILHERYTADGTAIDPQVVIKGVRVKFEGQGRPGGGYLTWPIAAGDKGTFEVQDRDIGKWATTGQANTPTLRFAHRSPAGFFKPGARDDTRKIPSFDPVACVLEATLIKLGTSATEAAVLGLTLKAYVDGLKAYIDALVLPVSGSLTPAGAVTGTAGPPVVPSPVVPDFLSNKVQIE